MVTKAKTVTKIHTSSQGILGNHHLVVEELALIKRIVESKKDVSDCDKKYLKELHQQAIIIDNFLKFKKNITHFIKWMVILYYNFFKLYFN